MRISDWSSDVCSSDLWKINRWHRGYVPLGQTKLDEQYTADQKESFNWGRATPEDHPDVRAGRVLTGPNLWPDEPAALRQALEPYYREMDALGRTHGV